MIFKFKIIKIVLISSFCFIWIPMLWTYGNRKYFNYFSAGIDFRRHNMTSKDGLIAERVNVYLTLWALTMH